MSFLARFSTRSPSELTGPDVSTNCLQNGSVCVYPGAELDVSAPEAAAAAVALGPPATLASSQPFVGCGVEYQLPPMSQWLFHQCESHHEKRTMSVPRYNLT